MNSVLQVRASRVGEAHVVFDLYDARWIMRLDKLPGEPLRHDEFLRLHGIVHVSQRAGKVACMVVSRITVRSHLSKYDQNDVAVWRPVLTMHAAERLDIARATALWQAGPKPPDAPPCLGIAASRWPSPDPTTTFALPSGGDVLALLHPQDRYGAGRGEWMPLHVRRDASSIVATYDYGRERRFPSLASFLDAHRVVTEGDKGGCGRSYQEQSPRALSALAMLGGLSWCPTHRIALRDLDADDCDVWFVDAGAASLEYPDPDVGQTPAPTFAEALRGEAATFVYNPADERAGDMGAGWTRDGENLPGAHPYNRAAYEIEALY